jgi:hypothetical protein
MRCVICGPPESGKTTLARVLLAGAPAGTELFDEYTPELPTLGISASWIAVVRDMNDLCSFEQQMATTVYRLVPCTRHTFWVEIDPYREQRDKMIESFGKTLKKNRRGRRGGAVLPAPAEPSE